jgi:DNA polymerase III subunit delta
MPTQRSQTESRSVPVYVVCGSEAFLKREALARITNEVLGKADRSLALTEYDAGSELAAVLDDLRTLPFLTDRRLVVVRDADAFVTRYRPELEDYFESPSPTGVLLLDVRTFPKNTRLYKRAQVVGQVVECEPMKGAGVSGWIGGRARDAYGKRLEGPAAAMLLDYVGQDLGLLDAELQKLTLYVGHRPTIAAADVEACVGNTREEQIWGLLSAVAAGDEARALSLWEHVWETDRAAPARAIGGIAFKVRQLLTAKRAQEGGAAPQQLAGMLGLWGSNAQRLKAELDAFTTAQAEQMLTKLLEADVAAKTGGPSVQSSVEAFIVEMCHARRRRATG